MPKKKLDPTIPGPGDVVAGDVVVYYDKERFGLDHEQRPRAQMAKVVSADGTMLMLKLGVTMDHMSQERGKLRIVKEPTGDVVGPVAWSRGGIGWDWIL